LDIITVEGIGSKKNGMHQVQKRLADFNGTQCGYCSPGMVMNMYSLLESKQGKVTMKEVENSFGGNICRCTGYRPILDAFKSLAVDADESLLSLCNDIEDLAGKTCPKTGTACAGKCSASEEINVNQTMKLTFDDDREWHKVYSIKEIFDTFGKIGDKPYMLVSGNTAHGVYRRSSNLKAFIDISNVEELRSHKVNADSLELGGNVTLSEAMEIFTKVAKGNKNFEYLNELVKHIDLIANVPVRNNGSIAGNLMIKNAHNEFPSDMFIMLQAAGAVLTVSNGTSTWSFPFLGNNVNLSPREFVKYDMKKKVLLTITLPAYDPAKFIFRSFKIMPRAQNAHAYVNAGFLLELNEQKTAIVSSRICFGGIDSNFVHAEKTEAALVGKDPFDNATIQAAANILKEEIKPDWVLPDVSPEYRENLAISLFYKFILNIVPDTKSSSKFKSGGKVLERELSSGTQMFDTYEKNWPLTKNIPKIEADVQCTGEAKYVNDFPSLPNEVYGAFATAKNVHGKIASIDASRALVSLKFFKLDDKLI
jgi:xanthine dehydrogenase/oxidase